MNQKLDLSFKPWQGFYLAFYSRDFWREAVKKWQGFGFGFYAYIVFINTILGTLVILFATGYFIDSFILPNINSMPDFNVQNGVMEYKSNKPFKFIPDNSDVVFLYINPNDDQYDKKVNAFVQVSPKHYFLNKLAGTNVNTSSSMPQTIESNTYPNNYNINKDSFIKFLKFLKLLPLLLIALYPIVLVLGILTLFIQGAIINLFVSSYNLTYNQVVRIAVIAATPNHILAAPLMLLELLCKIKLGILTFVIWIIYLVLIIRAQAKNDYTLPGTTT